MANPPFLRSPALRLFLSGAALMLGGCATKSTAKATENNPPAKVAPVESIGGYAINDANFLELGYRRDWTAFPYVGKKEKLQMLQPAGDAVLTLESGSTITALETSNGAIRWANEVATPLARIVGLNRVGDKIFVSEDSELIFLSATNGDTLNRQDYSRVVNTPPVIIGGLCIYGTTTGHVLAHRLDLGLSRWSFLLKGAIDHKPVSVMPLDSDDAVIGAVSQSGQYVFLSSKTGKPLGRGEIFAGIDTDPIAAQGLMIVAGRDQSLWGLRPNGEVAWRVRADLPLSRQPSTDGKTVWCQMGTEGLCAIDAATGKILWSNRVVEGTVIGTRAGGLLVWNGSLALILDRDRGDIVRSFVVPNTAILQTDKFEDGNLYAVSDKGVVVRFVPRS
ncbi:MAG: PQQ-binding-like beta-propeller repeat protein [Phycisphaerales bacterium]|nr:PQQ-binding-like beta-propeller repeat protein [Planctomycetota bacterium]